MNEPESFHYELFVDCRPKDAPDTPIQQISYRDMDEIQPDEKELHMTAQGRHTLVTHLYLYEYHNYAVGKYTVNVTVN